VDFTAARAARAVRAVRIRAGVAELVRATREVFQESPT